MTYSNLEGSAASGGPVMLFRFVYGSEAGEYLAYTSHTEALTVTHDAPVGEITYTPVPINRGNIVSNGTLDKSAIRVSLDVGTDLAELFRVYPPSSVTALTIYEGHIDDPDDEFAVVWAGRIISATRAGSELQLSGEPVSTQLRRTGLRRHYQYGCPLVLFGQELGLGGCAASKAAATVASTVSAIDGTVITLAPGWEGAFDPAKFVRGQVEWTPAGETTRSRTILRVSGDEISLTGIPSDLAVSDAVSVVLGCNHRAFAADGGDCEGLHDVLPSYGGDPWIPTKNVINTNPYY
jgi:hypothetical protein